MNKYNKNPFVQIWQVLYPLLLYYAVVLIVLSFARTIVGQEESQYVFCQLIATIVAIPIMLPFYRVDQAMLGQAPLSVGKKELRYILWAVLLALCFSVALNNLISMSPLVELSEGYQEANANFYGSTFALEFISSAIATPILEELVFRGIVYGRVRRMVSVMPAILISSLLFAVVHFNVVQFVYALLMGILFAFLVEHCGHMYVAVTGHIVSNAVAVIRTETGFLSQTVDKSVFAWGVSVAALVLGLLLLVLFVRLERNVTNE